jgi:phenylacetate-coenzyme A ligase PaaK-like adenylate-forming protein
MMLAAAESPRAEVLRARAGEILAIDSWPRERVLDLRRRRLRALIEHAVAHSPYYREVLGPDAPDAPLAELPTLTKQQLMESFDDLLTDRSLRLADLARFTAAAAAGELYNREFHVFVTSGSTGAPGLFVYTRSEFAEWVANALAQLASRGVGPSTRLTAIGAPSDIHITRQLFAAFQSGRERAPRLSVTTPLPDIVESLNAYRPEVLMGYASLAGTLADEQLDGRLRINPRQVVVGSEVLTEDTERRVGQAWGIRPVNVYAATEAPLMAVGHSGAMRVLEHSVVLEVVDAAGRPVPPGVPGGKVLLTSFISRTQPLIRYELSDSVVVAHGDDPEGLPHTRLAGIDGRSDDILSLPAARGSFVSVHPHRLRTPFTTLLDVRQYQIVHRRDGSLHVRVVPRAASPELVKAVGAAVARVLADAGAIAPVGVELVDEIEREPGPAAKIKVVVSEAGPS